MVVKAEIFMKPTCYFCKSALELLADVGAEIEAIDVTTFAPEMFTDFINKTSKTNFAKATVPQIRLDGKYIGGFEDLEKTFSK